jgi:hypothetical protein
MKVPKLFRTTALAAGLMAASVPSLSVPAEAAWGAASTVAGTAAGGAVAGTVVAGTAEVGAAVGDGPDLVLQRVPSSERRGFGIVRLRPHPQNFNSRLAAAFGK